MTILLLKCVSSHAQNFSKKKQYAVFEFGLSQSYFLGQDVKFSENNFVNIPGFVIDIKQKKTPRFSTGIQFVYNRLSHKTNASLSPEINNGTNETFDKYRLRTLQYGGFITMDYYENRGTWKKRQDHNLFLYFGMNRMHFKSKLRNSDSKVLPRELSMFDMDRRALVIQFGTGYIYKLAKRWDFIVELLWNTALSSHLDLNFENGFVGYGYGNDSYLTLNIKINR